MEVFLLSLELGGVTIALIGLRRERWLRRRRRYRQTMEDRRDRRLDTWIETGRQFVDGVSGRRPGQRRSSFDLDSVGRWVGDKVEWLLEEDDAWREPWQDTDRPLRSGKRPLEAISRRGRQARRRLERGNERLGAGG